MLKVYIFVGVLVLGILFFTIWLINKLLVPQINMQKSGSGKKTKFIIDTNKNGYEYYENIIKEWLKYNKFSKYNKKSNGRYLKFHSNGCIFNFGFNYYKADNSLIIETWLLLLNSEHPITFKTYSYKDNDINLVNSLTGDSIKVSDNSNILVNQQGKDEYIKFLNSLINMPKQLNEENHVSLKDTIDYKEIKNQKTEKRKTLTLISFIFGISIIIITLIYLPIYLSKPKPSENDKQAALDLIKNSHPSFKLEEYSTSVRSTNTNEYVISYIFYGTMITPNSNNDKVIIFMSNSGNSNYNCIGEDCNWAGNIYQNKTNGTKWDFYLNKK